MNLVPTGTTRLMDRASEDEITLILLIFLQHHANMRARIGAF